MARLIYFEPFAGASGDMILGALLGLGVPLQLLQEQLAALQLPDWDLSHEEALSHHMVCHRAKVRSGETHPHRGLSEISALLKAAFPAHIAERCLSIFDRLAEAEAKVHGMTKSEIHFHEVGAVDAIVDIAGAVLGLDYLGAQEIYCASFPIGEGQVRCEHGVLPNPAPATMELIRGWPLRSIDCSSELLTPTGAAILTTLATPGRPSGEFLIQNSALGAGTRELPFPNVLRASLGTRLPASGTAWQPLSVLETLWTTAVRKCWVTLWSGCSRRAPWKSASNPSP